MERWLLRCAALLSSQLDHALLFDGIEEDERQTTCLLLFYSQTLSNLPNVLVSDTPLLDFAF